MNRLTFPLVFATAAALPFATVSQTVTVVRGDSLSSIAARELGSAARWPDLCELNRELLNDNCDLVVEGSVLRLSEDVPLDQTSRPSDADDHEIDAAAQTDAAEDATGSVAGADSSEGAHADGGEQPADDMASDDSAVAADPEPADSDAIAINLVADVPPEFQARAPYTVSSGGPNGGVVLSGFVPDAASSGRPGIFAIVPEAVEEAASGSRVEIAATLFSATPTQALIAYSTNEVGNSGWQSISATPQGARSAFVYNVSELNAGRGDFVGILPDPENTGQTVEVTDITITILGEP